MVLNFPRRFQSFFWDGKLGTRRSIGNDEDSEIAAGLFEVRIRLRFT
jgi:hypothetical protein